MATNTPMDMHARFAERGCTKEAIERFAKRYPHAVGFYANGCPIGVIPRLQLALQIIQAGKYERSAHGHGDRLVFDVELPADQWVPEPYTIRVLTNPEKTVILTVLPPEWRTDLHAAQRREYFRRPHDEETEPEPNENMGELPATPSPVKVAISLGDVLRAALNKEAA